MLLVFIILVASSWGLYHALEMNSLGWAIASTSLISFSLLIYVLLWVIRKLPGKFEVPPAFLKPFKKLLKVRFNVYKNMIFNRSHSMLKLTSEVFLKHIRRLNYNQIYKDNTWKNRRIMNAIYELRKENSSLEKKIEEGKIPQYLIPTPNVREVASTASSMGTTLWFTKKELEKDDMLNSIIACGQFTMCWNLLEYIDDVKNDEANTNQNHQLFIQIEDQLKELWGRFKEDPKWMVGVYTEK
jgi:hypothetical protein